MSEVDKKEAWLALGQKFLNVCEGILQQANFVEADASNHKVVALTLLCRTANNFAGARLLLENDFIVEARTLVRCSLENFFWIGGLTAKGDDFVKEMVLDDAASKFKGGAELLQWAKKQEGAFGFEKKLEDFLEKVKAENPKPPTIKHKNAADAAAIGDAYIIYRELSRDAAHPSVTSLSRHLVDDPEGVTALTLRAERLVEEAEVVATLEYGCFALLGVCVGTNDLVGGTTAGKELTALWEEYKALSAP